MLDLAPDMPSARPPMSRKWVPIRLIRPVITCFSETKSWNLNNLILISFCLHATPWR
jgi:hypothetical protein